MDGPFTFVDKEVKLGSRIETSCAYIDMSVGKVPR